MTVHVALHNNGHVNNRSKSSQHQENLNGHLHSLHCGYTSLQHNRNVQPLSMNWIRGTSIKRLLELVAA